MGMGVAGLLTVILSIAPSNGGVLTTPTIPINVKLGDQYDPHVDQDLAAYSSFFDNGTVGIEEIRYYDFGTAVDLAIPRGLADGGAGRDLLSDVDQGRIVFTRIFADGTSSIMLFDAATAGLTELAPAPNSQRLGVALGSQTAAFIDYGLSGDGSGELMALNLAGGGVTRITNDTVVDLNPAVSPDGNVITWERCPVSQANCDIYTAQRSGSTWQWKGVTSSLLTETNADTNGTLVVFERTNPTGPTGTDLVIVPAAGGAETVIELPGEQHNPSIRGQLVAFESRATTTLRSDIFVLDLATNRVFQITNTLGVNETLNDVTVLPAGEVRLVWQANDGTDGLNNIYGTTFSLPAPPTPDAGVPAVDAGVCAPRSVVLEATRTYAPTHWTDGHAAFAPAFDFAIPTELPVVAGNAGNHWASLTFDVGTRTIACRYRGGSSQAHPSSPAQRALAARYVFSSCLEVSRGPGHGCDGEDDDQDDDDSGDDDSGDDDSGDNGHGGHGGHARHHGSGNGRTDGGTPHHTWLAGDVVQASSLTLHVHNGDSWQPLTRVRLALTERCSTSTSMHPLDAAGAPEGPSAAGCSSAGGTLAPMLALFAFGALLLRRRPAAIRLVARREQRRLPR